MGFTLWGFRGMWTLPLSSVACVPAIKHLGPGRCTAPWAHMAAEEASFEEAASVLLYRQF